MNDQRDDTVATDYLTEIAELTKAVDNGHAMVAEGTAIDLSNLEEVVGDLCQRMANNPPADPTPVMEAIEQLVQRLGALSDALQSQARTSH